MKKTIIAVLALAFLMPVMAGAQVLKGSYFLDNSVNRHKMNPAFAPRANYFQLPVIGNVGVGLYSNLDVPLFTYPVNGKLGTFLHPSVSVEQFERNMPKHPHMDVDFSTNILSFGFYTKNKAFWTFELDTRIMMDVDLPRDIFVFMKKGAGTSGESFNVGNANLYATAGVQAALGYSRDIIKGLRGGLKVRLIAPVAYAGVNLENIRLNTGSDKWTINTEGYAYTAVNGLDMNIQEGQTMPQPSFNLNKCLTNGVLSGFGYSLDIGFEYKLEVGCPVDGLAFSLAVTDLGQIFYKNNVVKAFSSAGSVEWTGFQDVTLESNESIEASMNELKEKLEGLLNLSEMEHPHVFSRHTMPKLYAGVELPFLKRKMSVGLLYSARFSHSYARHELTASYNLKPCRWFALGINYSFLNTTRSLGWMLELTPKAGPTLYFGGDYFPLEYANAPLMEGLLGDFPMNVPALGVTDWILPTSSRMNFCFGIAFNLGSKYVNPKKEKKK